MIKNVIIAFVVLLLAITVILLFTIKFVPGEKISATVGEDNVLSDILCMYPIKVKGDSMAPAIEQGEYVVFDKCIEDKKVIEENLIVLFQFGGRLKIGRVREIKDDNNKLVFMISSDNEKDNLYDIPEEDLLGVFYVNEAK